MSAMLRAMPGVILLSMGALSMAATPAQAKSACEKSASEMRISCNFELREEFHNTLANCKQFEDPEDCKDQAREERWEAVGLCREQYHARVDACELLDEDYYAEPLLDSVEFIDPNDIGSTEDANPYFSLQAGHTYVARAGEDFEETIVVHVTDESREILGVDCRLVVDIVLLYEDGEYIAIEVTDDYYAQSIYNDVYYCGETARNFEDGVLRDLDGSFEAGLDYAKSGILIKAHPSPLDAHRQEYLLGEAEDIIQYVGLAEAPGGDEGGDNPNPDFSCSMNGGCVKTEEFIPPEPSAGEFKYFLEDVGFVLGVGLEDGMPTGERDETRCVGESFDILDEVACDIDDLAGLKAELCSLSPAFDAVCDD